MTSSKTDPRLLEVLASLNEIGATVNQIGLDGTVSIETTLNLIVKSAIRVVPGASAVIYTYDVAQDNFIHASRVSAGGKDQPDSGDEPRANGLGIRAIVQRRRVLSYEEKDVAIHPIRSKAGARVMGCFPLIVADQPVGALYVYLQEDRQFSQIELLMLDNFVNQAAMAIYHAHNLSVMQHDLARKEDELTRLRRAGLLISSRLRLEETLEAILQMALEVTRRCRRAHGPPVDRSFTPQFEQCDGVGCAQPPSRLHIRLARRTLVANLLSPGCQLGDALRAGGTVDRSKWKTGRCFESGKSHRRSVQ